MLILLLPLIFGLTAFILGTLDVSGVLLGIAFGYVVLLSRGIDWFCLLLAFFVCGAMATATKAGWKRKMGLYQQKRNFQNVIGNGLIAVLMALFGSLGGFVGALATATADTMSSEIGVLSSKRPFLITNLKRVKAGTNGGVSPLGTSAALCGSAIIGALAFVIGGERLFSIALLAGMGGCFVDSVIGAVAENRHITSNWSTNLIATLSGALIGWVML